MSNLVQGEIGLVIGKFMPLHNGHVELIKFALRHCECLEIALVCNENDSIPGNLRQQWLVQTLETIIQHNELCKDKSFKIVRIDEVLPRTIGHTEDAFREWTQYFASRFAHTNLIISSEDYAEELAYFMGIKHILFDKDRKQTTVYASDILQHPESYLRLVPEYVREYLLEMIEKG